MSGTPRVEPVDRICLQQERTLNKKKFSMKVVLLPGGWYVQYNRIGLQVGQLRYRARSYHEYKVLTSLPNTSVMRFYLPANVPYAKQKWNPISFSDWLGPWIDET